MEIFCARQHLDYRDRAQITELGHWFRDSKLKLHSLHSPMYSDEMWGRSGPNAHINITEPVKSKRLDMLDEIKRALDISEVIPFRYLIQHLGVFEEEYDERKIDAAFTSLEELNLFARARGVEVLLENTPNQLSSAHRLVHFLEQTHLKLNFCFDVGHANMNEGVAEAFGILKDRIRSTHPARQQQRKTAILALPFPGRHDRLERNHGPAAVASRVSVRCCWSCAITRVPASAIARHRAANFDKLEGMDIVAYSRIRIEDAGRHTGEPVEIAGWLYNLRKSGKIVFPLLRDGTGTIQCVAVKAIPGRTVFEELKNLTQESSLMVRGKIRAEQRAPGGYEMDVEGAEVVQRIPESDPYPITPKEHGIEFLMDHAICGCAASDSTRPSVCATK